MLYFARSSEDARLYITITEVVTIGNIKVGISNLAYFEHSMYFYQCTFFFLHLDIGIHYFSIRKTHLIEPPNLTVSIKYRNCRIINI